MNTQTQAAETTANGQPAAQAATYAVGRGRPPAHSRWR
jgi:hypothetical protein